MKNCLICGAKNSMHPFTEKTSIINICGKKLVTFENLSGSECSECGESFYNEESQKRINDEIRKVNRIGVRS